MTVQEVEHELFFTLSLRFGQSVPALIKRLVYSARVFRGDGYWVSFLQRQPGPDTPQTIQQAHPGPFHRMFRAVFRRLAPDKLVIQPETQASPSHTGRMFQGMRQRLELN